MKSILTASIGIKHRGAASKMCVIYQVCVSTHFKDAIVAAHQSGKDYKVISKNIGVHHFTVRKIIYKWTTFKTVAGSELVARSRQGQTVE